MENRNVQLNQELSKLFMDQKRLLAQYERHKQISSKFRSAPSFFEHDKEGIERELWLNATCQVLLQVGKPVPQAGISQAVLAQGIIPPDMTVSLSDAVQKELNRKSRSRIKGVPGQPGVICLADSCNINPRHKQKKEKTVAEWREQYREMRRRIKNNIFLNSAYCDEIAKVEEEISHAKNVRRAILKKLLTTMVEQSGANGKVSSAALDKLIAVSKNAAVTPNKRVAAPRKKKTIRETLEKPKLLIQPVQVDSNGKTVFPVEINSELKIHSVGNLVSDDKLLGFHDNHHIYPIGYCSQRKYIQIIQQNPLQVAECNYKCIIEDGIDKPTFVILGEDRFAKRFVSNNINNCHSLFLQYINKNQSKPLIPMDLSGITFFGLDNPDVMNLIQCIPGAKKCTNYQWKKFTVSKKEGICKGEVPKISVSYDAALKYLNIE